MYLHTAFMGGVHHGPHILFGQAYPRFYHIHTGINLLDMMKDLNQTQNMTFVFSTHDQKIMDRASRLIHLVDGRINEDEHK